MIYVYNANTREIEKRYNETYIPTEVFETKYESYKEQLERNFIKLVYNPETNYIDVEDLYGSVYLVDTGEVEIFMYDLNRDDSLSHYFSEHAIRLTFTREKISRMLEDRSNGYTFYHEGDEVIKKIRLNENEFYDFEKKKIVNRLEKDIKDRIEDSKAGLDTFLRRYGIPVVIADGEYLFPFNTLSTALLLMEHADPQYRFIDLKYFKGIDNNYDLSDFRMTQPSDSVVKELSNQVLFITSRFNQIWDATFEKIKNEEINNLNELDSATTPKGIILRMREVIREMKTEFENSLIRG